MNPIIEANKSQIEELCRKYGVAKLEIFGSANTPDFDPDRSDFDFIVEFEDYGPGIADRYFNLLDELSTLLDRDIDLVSACKLKQKPRFSQSANATREKVFVTTSRDVAA